ncbi:hypothetical protein GIB67_014159 [Kingdonia uniflora]|uniref:Uncharacterized protein n=1 Tax=Kingdonia uniflora TaxID=39325 RepID=A0A7J7NDI7_9MAGN|nr:hypothetical protein GIB67_014159 [Kingdonia uniflora]
MAKGLGSRRWEYSSVAWGKLDSTADSHPDTKESALKMGRSSVKEVSASRRTNESDSEGEGGLEQFLGFHGQFVSYPLGSDAFIEFCKAKEAIGGKWGQTWNDNIIWLKGNCLQRDDEELLDLRFKSVKQSVKSTMERKESLLDEVADEEAELELVLGELGLSKKKRVESRSKKIKKALMASGTTVSGGVAQGKRRRVESLGDSGEKVVEGRSTTMDDLKEVEERARLAILQGNKDMSQMVSSLVKGIWFRIEEQESELKKAKSELNKNLARAKMEALKEVRQLKAGHAVAIGQLQVEAKANLDEMAEEHDRLVLDNQGVDVELPEGGSEKAVRDMSLRIIDLELGLSRERMTLKALLSARAESQVELDASRAPKRDQTIARSKKAEARERSGGSITVVKAPLVQGDVVSLSGRIRELESDVSRIQGHVQNGNANLRECQYKLDAALIWEKFLEEEIKAKKFLVKKKEKLLKDLPAREELNPELGRRRT